MQVDNTGWLVEVSMLLVFSRHRLSLHREAWNQQEVVRHLRESLAQPIGYVFRSSEGALIL